MPRYSLFSVFVFAILLVDTPPARAQDAASLQSYFVGKEVVVKVDMPGSQKGVDLRFNKPSTMDWKEYGSRIKQFGVAIPKGDTARVTSLVVKRDMIEFQLDGGGFGVAGDDTTTKVDAKPLDKSDYEKSLEQQISQTDDPDKKAALQKELDREQAKRQRQDSINAQQAAYASQQKAMVVAQNRAQGGSRFNLRWSGSIPPDGLTPDGIMKYLSDYVTFPSTSAGNHPDAGTAPATAPTAVPNPSATSKLQRGMKQDDVTALLGLGKQLSESVGDGGLKTQVYEYTTSERHIQVTYVNGVVVQYTINSN
jgi:hypothetical protein